MGKINVLDFEIANLIAAGEVVERPSSVMKELIENSIDSGAKRIVAEIKKGGVALIRVTDDGCGISRDDLPVALKRHATSKISTKEDLEGITTLGFRGEALAAISSVSSVTIITRTKDSDVGHMLTSEAGQVLEVCEVGAGEGTTVVVENLFYNVPARRKFLKKDVTEALNVAALVEKVALSRPDISIQLLIDGQEKFNTPGGGDLKSALRAIWGKDFASRLIAVDGDSDGIRVSGYVGRSDNVRKNRNLENVFINGRYVKSLTAQAAIEKAYTSYIAPECFPVTALYIEMNPGTVDVNVHPSKLEVKFSDERRVFEAVYYAVRTALEAGEYRPEMTLGTGNRDRNSIGAFVPLGQNTAGEQIAAFASQVKQAPASSSSSIPKGDPVLDRPLFVSNGAKDSVSRFNGQKNSFDLGNSQGFERHDVRNKERFDSAKVRQGSMSPSESLAILDKLKVNEELYRGGDHAENSLNDAPLYKYVGEAFDCYVIVELQGELLIIDKHAAHERVIFEDLLLQRKQQRAIASQDLILPLTVILSEEEMSSAKEYISEFKNIGFNYNFNGKGVDILSIPEAISVSDAGELFQQMTDELSHGLGNPENTENIRLERALYQVACKAAIKGGREYGRPVIDWLIKKVLMLPDITVCPHGRPIAYKLSKRELDRQFNRIK